MSGVDAAMVIFPAIVDTLQKASQTARMQAPPRLSVGSWGEGGRGREREIMEGWYDMTLYWGAL